MLAAVNLSMGGSLLLLVVSCFCRCPNVSELLQAVTDWEALLLSMGGLLPSLAECGGDGSFQRWVATWFRLNEKKDKDRLSFNQSCTQILLSCTQGIPFFLVGTQVYLCVPNAKMFLPHLGWG